MRPDLDANSRDERRDEDRNHPTALPRHDSPDAAAPTSDHWPFFGSGVAPTADA